MINTSARRVACCMTGLLLSACTTTSVTTSVAKTPTRNVILFLGDGMGVSTVTAARIYAGQLQGFSGEEHVLAFETFPHLALVKTYNTDSQVADSAGTMSAIMTGEKTRIGYISVGPAAARDDCEQARANELTTLLEEAERAGYATGIVSTARITHATPAATYAHVPNRDWETDEQLPAAAHAAGCTDIARQLVEFEPGDGIEVILGGGRAQFMPTETADPEYPELQGERTDGANLIDRWLGGDSGREYVWNAQQLAALEQHPSGQVLGLFEPSHMQFEADRAEDSGGEPSLAEMTRFAIKRLAANGRGYFLMVEGGRIDHAHHAGNAYRALDDTLALSDAVATALEITDPAETLIVVTADHSHTLTISGYPKRGNPILGKVVNVLGEAAEDDNGRPYTTLGYANGPGFLEELADLSDVNTEDRDYLQVASFPAWAETHGGEDVAAYAFGPNAEALGGVIEQDELYQIMRTALLGSEN